MAMQKKHAAVLDATLPALYDNGEKTNLGSVPPGTLILMRFEDKLGDEVLVDYQLLIAYAQNLKTTKCAEPDSVYSYAHSTNIVLAHSEQCVMLSHHTAPLRLYLVEIKSRASDPDVKAAAEFKGSAQVLANSVEQAQEMAISVVMTNIQGFLDGPVRSPRKNPPQLDRKAFVESAVYETTLLTSQPSVLKSEWDMTK